MKVDKTLAFVDDDPVYIYITKKTLLKSDLVGTIQEYNNGLDVLNFIKENITNTAALPDIILLDLSMPVMDGWQFLKAYETISNKIVKNIIICICSSSISPDDVNRAKGNPLVTDYIVKPVQKEKLIEIISKS